jgi:hypothetical protein
LWTQGTRQLSDAEVVVVVEQGNDGPFPLLAVSYIEGIEHLVCEASAQEVLGGNYQSFPDRFSGYRYEGRRRS